MMWREKKKQKGKGDELVDSERERVAGPPGGLWQWGVERQW